MRCVIYVRLSDHRGNADPSTSPERQEAICRSYAAAREWDVVRVVSDLAVSGSDKGLRLERPGIVEVRGLWSQVDVLVVSKLDRLARNVVDFHGIAEEAAEHGVQVVAVAEGLDLTTPAGKFTATILAAFAQMEAATISTRITESIAELRRVGRYAGGVLPYGYVSAPAPGGRGRILVPDPAEAEVVRGMADDILHGATTFRVARELNQRQVPTKRGGSWSQTGVISILTSNAIIGRVTHQGNVVRGDDGEPVQAYEPVLDRETWNRVRVVLGSDRERAEPGSQRRRQSDLLSGLLRCAVCDARLYSRQTEGRRRYRCATVDEGGSCRANSIQAPAVNEYVVARYLEGYGDRARYELVFITRDDHALDDTESAIREVTRSLANATDNEMGGLLKRLAELRARRSMLRAVPAETRRELRPTGRTHREDWAAADGDIDRQRQMLAAVYAAVLLRPAADPTKRTRTPDLERVVLLENPVHVLGVSDDQAHTVGRAVVQAPDLTNEPDWK